MWNWFKRLPIGKKIRVIAWGAIGLSILGLMLGFSLNHNSGTLDPPLQLDYVR